MLASLISRTAALSTIFLTVKRLIALSFGTQREQLEQRMNVTWPRPFLLRPPFLLFFVYWTWNKNRVSVNASKKLYHDWKNLSTSKPSEAHPTHFDQSIQIMAIENIRYTQQSFDTEKVAHHIECRGREAMCWTPTSLSCGHNVPTRPGPPSRLWIDVK